MPSFNINKCISEVTTYLNEYLHSGDFNDLGFFETHLKELATNVSESKITYKHLWESNLKIAALFQAIFSKHSFCKNSSQLLNVYLPTFFTCIQDNYDLASELSKNHDIVTELFLVLQRVENVGEGFIALLQSIAFLTVDEFKLSNDKVLFECLDKIKELITNKNFKELQSLAACILHNISNYNPSIPEEFDHIKNELLEQSSESPSLLAGFFQFCVKNDVQTRKTLSSVEKMVSLLDGIFNLIKLESELFIIDMLFGFSRYIMFKVDTTLTDTGEIWVKRKDFKEFIKNMFDYTYSVKRKPNALKLFLKAILTFTENPTCKDGIYNWMVDETLKSKVKLLKTTPLKMITGYAFERDSIYISPDIHFIALKLLSVITGHAISKNYEYASNKSKDNFIEFIFILFEDTHIISEIPLKLVYRRNALVLILLKQCLKDKHYEGTIENKLTMQKIMGIFYINSIFAVKIKNCLKFGEVLDDNTIEMISMIYTLIELVGKLSTTSSQYKNVFDRICHEETLPMMIATGILSNSENLIAESLYINKVSPNYIFKTVANYIYESMKKRKDLSNDPCAKVNLSEKGYQDQINGNQIIIQKYLNENQLLNEELGKIKLLLMDQKDSLQRKTISFDNLAEEFKTEKIKNDNFRNNIKNMLNE